MSLGCLLSLSLLTAAWRIFDFKMHERLPAVTRLQLHLPDQQMVVFDTTDPNREQLLHRSNIRKTTLTEFFVACQKYPGARDLTYPQMPSKFVWYASKKEWTPRKQRNSTIGRVYFAGPAAGERYYLRMLLYVVKGPRSWDELKTVDEVIHGSFQAACIARGLLESDDEFDKCLQEVGGMQMGWQFRHLFAIILLECGPANPLLLWEKHAFKLSDDCEWRLRHQLNIQAPTDEQISSLALHELNEILLRSGKSLQDFGLPLPTHHFDHLNQNIPRIVAEETSYDQLHLNEMCQRCLEDFNLEQRAAFDAVIAAYDAGEGGIFFVDGPGGTGKTFLENMILAKVRSTGNIALAVASSGIAAILLDGGRTAHSRFKIPINAVSGSRCSISMQSDLGELIRLAKVIIWDEAPKLSKRLFATSASAKTNPLGEL
jgi:PIF1-like helicase